MIHKSWKNSHAQASEQQTFQKKKKLTKIISKHQFLKDQLYICLWNLFMHIQKPQSEEEMLLQYTPQNAHFETYFIITVKEGNSCNEIHKYGSQYPVLLYIFYC